MGVRLVATDLDGTLLGPGDEPSTCGVWAMRAAASHGVTVVLATGRMLVSAEAVQRVLGVAGPIIAYNGGRVRLTDGTVWEEAIPLPVAQEIGQFCQQHGYLLQAYVGDDLVVPWEDQRTRAYSLHAGVPCYVDPGQVFTPEVAPTKLLLLVAEEQCAEVVEDFRERYGTVVDVARSMPEYVEINCAGVSKGRALQRVAEHLGVPLSEVLAIGDAENDLPMLRLAGIAAAPANATSAARELAKVTASRPYGDGVAEIIRHCVLRTEEKDGDRFV